MNAFNITCHLITLPVRYAIGRWYNMPTNTLLTFNAANIGLDILVDSTLNYATPNYYKKIPRHLQIPFSFASVIVYCLTAVCATSTFTEAMPLKAAALTSLAALITGIFAAAVILYIYPGGKK
jgi:hypothetical protein